MPVVFNIEGRIVTIRSNQIVIESPQRDETRKSTVLNINRAEHLALAAALRETAPLKKSRLL